MKKLFFPLIIWLIFVSIYLGYTLISGNDFLFQPVWDVKHYVDISETGYEARPCGPTDYPPGKICGNVGWYPAWPLAVKLIRPILGGSSPIAFTVLPFLFSLIGFMLIYKFIENYHDRSSAVFTLTALTFSPAAFYLLSGFPYAFFLFLFSLYITLLYRPANIKNDTAVFIVAAAISLTYPTGILFAAIPAIMHLLPGENRKENGYDFTRWLHLLRYVFPFILGLLLLWLYFYIKFDNFFIQLDFQEKYQRTWAIPVIVMIKSLADYSLFSPENAVIIWYSLAFILFIPYRLKPELWIMGLLLLLFSPATGSVMSIYRHYMAIFPIYMIIGTSEKPHWLKAGFAIMGLILALLILFPEFLSSRLI